eukprot:COSAG02_NODE_4658_length_5125_cov_4.436331_2_plen_87_part_00
MYFLCFCTYEPAREAGIWILSQEIGNYTVRRIQCERVTVNFATMHPQVQNEFPLQTPISERAAQAPAPGGEVYTVNSRILTTIGVG